MSAYIPAQLRTAVEQRANNTCEYCRIHETFSMYSHEIDHAIAQKHGGQTIENNLVLACLPCNRHKGSDLTSLDPHTGEITPLFNPRQQQWSDHFKIENGQIEGLTAIGRTTIFLLRFNTPQRVQLRAALAARGLYPNLPPDFPTDGDRA
ncbi:MAG: HNH endonuclease [Geitlerinemataceae cyanobacterium]